MTRREAVSCFSAFLAGSPLVRGQLDLPYNADRVPALEDLVNVFEFEPICRARVPRQSYDYMAGGVDNEWSLRHNREAFDKIMLRPRMLVNASNMDLSLTLFGDKIDFPILIAPTAGHGLLHPEGEIATAKAAEKMKTIHVLSTNASQPLEKVAEASSFPKWFQLYAGPDLEGTWERVERARTAGYKTIVFTVDAPYSSHRERLLRNRVAAQVPSGLQTGPHRTRRQREDAETPKPHPYGLGTTLVHQLDWTFVSQLKDRSKLPVLIKGVLTGEDAALAVKNGADGIVVSNHGGRYLEYAPATIEVLPEIIAAVNGKIPVLVDSGFRRGTDVIKALAMGAKAVLVGRPPLWGLGAYGSPGVARVLDLLRSELALAMGLCGKPNLDSIDRSLLKTIA